MQQTKLRLRAFTLTELLVVLVIIGILVLLPNLMPLISKAKSTEAQLQLKQIHTLEKTFFYMHSKYSEDLASIDFEQSKLTTEGGQANYQLEIVEAGNTNFLARATAVVDFDGDGVLSVWEIDQDNMLREVTKD